MKRTLSSLLAIAMLSFAPITLVGCGEESKVKETETVTSPGGTTQTTKEDKIKSTGDNPPPNSQGETAKTK